MSDEGHLKAIRQAQKALNVAMLAAAADGLEIAVDDQSRDGDPPLPPRPKVHIYITRHL